MNDLVDTANYEDLKACDPKEVTQRIGCAFDSELNQYVVNIWEYEYVVDLNIFQIHPKGGENLPAYHGFIDLFILYYLMKSKNTQPSGEWVSEKDIPGGAAFFRGPHTLPTSDITNRFEDDLSGFELVCKAAEGLPLELADKAFVFQITPTIPVAVLYWQGDKDFPSEAKLLFDRTIQDHLPLDIIYSLAVGVCYRLGKIPAA